MTEREATRLRPPPLYQNVGPDFLRPIRAAARFMESIAYRVTPCACRQHLGQRPSTPGVITDPGAVGRALVGADSTVLANDSALLACSNIEPCLAAGAEGHYGVTTRTLFLAER